MRLIVATDIFGQTSCLLDLLRCLATKYESIEVVDPYSGRDFSFDDEPEAYAHFLKTSGLEKYASLVSDRINTRRYSCDHLLGFSIGASAIWIASENIGSPWPTKAICFYSSQIRLLLDVQPKIDVDIYFPRMEPKFNVDQTMEILRRKPFVNCFKTNYLHGFMNKKSENFDLNGYQSFIQILTET